MKDLIVLIVILFMCLALYVKWWSCSEMFPHAPLACFISFR